MSDSENHFDLYEDSGRSRNSSKITQEQLQSYNIEELMQKAGGFGCMQWLLLLYVLICGEGINIFAFTFAYLELVPKVL